VTENSKSGTENKIFHTFLERNKCYNVEITKLPNIHRATAISCDPRGKNFAAIQVRYIRIQVAFGLFWKLGNYINLSNGHMKI
jgi:hypothetical protein